MIVSASNGDENFDLLEAIRKRLAAQGGGLRPQEAVMLLDWAIEAEDPKRKADLLDLFAQAGGMRLLREAVLGDEPGEKSDDD